MLPHQHILMQLTATVHRDGIIRAGIFLQGYVYVSKIATRYSTD